VAVAGLRIQSVRISGPCGVDIPGGKPVKEVQR